MSCDQNCNKETDRLTLFAFLNVHRSLFSVFLSPPKSQFLRQTCFVNLRKKSVQEVDNPFCSEIAIPNCSVDGRSSLEMQISPFRFFLVRRWRTTRTVESEDVENRIARIPDAWLRLISITSPPRRETTTLRKQLVNGTRTKFTSRSSYAFNRVRTF